jgi:REP element-mobilizing transposase RayT
MPTHGSHTELYIHLVWTTHGRIPLLAEEIRAMIHGSIRSKGVSLGAEVIALNGVEDHVHLFVRMPSALSVATLAKEVKGASSHFATHQAGCESFRWQDGYSAFSVSRWDVPKLSGYIEGQEGHHRCNTTKPALEPPPSSIG